MKKIILAVSLLISSTSLSFSQGLSNPKGGGVLDIISITPEDVYSKITFEGQVSGYGNVFVAFKVAAINSSKNSGTLDGNARTILEDGTLITSPMKGTWKRMGANMMFYFTDAVNNGALNFVIFDVDLLQKTAEVTYYELHAAED
ncbi:MAG: hypothetical protein CBC65_008520 [Rhodothermaceae bacterium TMED105]|nr:MAG: hypothetical protein CBC65_008520 [Rhodothermaceae bacterium TMED105]|tara:strand:- start:1012 stop:1446 length:435 start_codon:yes stop_codon:yes gene_type:complete